MPSEDTNDKFWVASRFQSLVRNIVYCRGLRCKTFLAGGGAVHYFSGSRPIKDLDLRIKFNAKLTRNQIIDQMTFIRKRLTEQGYPFKRSVKGDTTINGTMNEIDISLTASNLDSKIKTFEFEKWVDTWQLKGTPLKTFIIKGTPLNAQTLIYKRIRIELERTRYLFADKVAAIAERSNTGKVRTDIQDLTAILEYKLRRKARKRTYLSNS